MKLFSTQGDEMVEFGTPGKSRSKRRLAGRHHNSLTNLPPRLQEEAQRILWSKDSEADIIWELPNDEIFRRSAKNASWATSKFIAGAKRAQNIDGPIYYCITSSKRIQACAFLLEGEYRCIALWMGGLIINQGTLNRLVTMPTMATHFLLEPRDDAILGPFDGLDTYAAFQKAIEPRPIMANSEPERNLVQALGSHLTAFITWHEIAHAINGHLLLPGAGPDASIFEVTGSSDTAHFDNLTFHVLEWDADCYAAIRVFLGALDTPMSVEQHYDFSGPLPLFEFRMMTAMIAIYVACRLFQTGAIKTATVMDYRHPPGAVRRLLMLPQALQAWRQHEVTRNLQFPSNAVQKAVQFCEAAIAEMTLVPAPDFDLVGSFPQSWFRSYQSQLHARWRELYPMLTKLKVGTQKLADPDETETWDMGQTFAQA